MPKTDDEINAYQSAGVDYGLLDAGKRQAIQSALSTSPFAIVHDTYANDASRGEPAFTFTTHGQQMAMVMECLGTKSSIAADYQDLTGKNLFRNVGYDTVAAIVNDLTSVGALPVVVSAYFATGSSAWYGVDGRFSALVEGWRAACEASSAIWGGGESPMLSGIISDGQIDLGGSAVGFFPQGHEPLLGERLQAGDEIVLVESNGLHTNGSSLARETAKVIGYDAFVGDGLTFGDVVLAPSHIYVALLSAIYEAGIELSYSAHITGHGFRKLMRADKDFTYRITKLPEPNLVFTVIADTLRLDEKTLYGTFNMGAGYALYCRPGDGARLVEVAAGVGLSARVSGVVEVGAKRVIIEEHGITFESDELQLR
jgi:phosphoribosylformylglycinamidine cyclo-ligase